MQMIFISFRFEECFRYLVVFDLSVTFAFFVFEFMIERTVPQVHRTTFVQIFCFVCVLSFLRTQWRKFNNSWLVC